jgi:hypothetical protein
MKPLNLQRKTSFAPSIMHEMERLSSPRPTIWVELSSINKLPSAGRLKNDNPWNETQRWLFAGSKPRFESLKSHCISRITHDERSGNFDSDEYEDYFMEWIADICQKDTLAPKVEAGEKINKNALYWWYRQYIQRASMRAAQDAHARARGARTQSEISLEKNPMHDTTKLGGVGMGVANVLLNRDPETGQEMGEPDYYYDEEDSPYAHVDMEERMDKVKYLLTRHYGESEGADRFKLFEEMVEDKGGYQTKEEWAASWGISRTMLNKRVEGVQKVLRLHKELFLP